MLKPSPLKSAKLDRPEKVQAPYPDRHSLALARDQVQVETALTRLRQSMASLDDMLLAGIQAKRMARRLDAAIREALHLAAAGADGCTVLAGLREALD